MTPHHCRRLDTHGPEPHQGWPSATDGVISKSDWPQRTHTSTALWRSKDDGAPSAI